MSWEAIGASAEVIGVVLVVVSLFFVAHQIRLSNRLGIAEAERAWFTKWHELIQAPWENVETAAAFRKGLHHYEALSSNEKAVFSGYLVALLDHAQAAHRMNQNGFLEDDLLEKIMTACIAYINTPGGSQWWSDVGPVMGIYQYVESLPHDEIPAFSEALSFLKTPD